MTRLWWVTGVLLLLAPAAVRAQDAADADLNTVRLVEANVVAISRDREGQVDGYGLIVGADAESVYITTANHVVRPDHEPANGRVFVAFSIGAAREVEAVVLAKHSAKRDIAVLRAPRPEGFSPRWDILGRLQADSVGVRVWVIGTPNGEIRTQPIAGTVEAVNHIDEQLTVTGLPVTPGLSGGPLVTKSGVVGMILQAASPNGQTRGLAVPIEVIQRAVEREWQLVWNLTLAPQGPPWPPGAEPGGVFTVTASEATMDLPLVRLPDRFTIRVSPEVRTIEWTIGRLEFGVGVTIDFSSSRPGAIGPAGVNQGGQPSWGVHGQPGGGGMRGEDGGSGVPFTIHLESVRAGGNLWIRTDGASGGGGGPGGVGQLGGGSSLGTSSGEPHTNGGNGGTGGDGGDGGDGGNTCRGIIHMRVRWDGTSPVTLINDLPDQGPGISERPEAARGDSGVIVIWGRPGAGGSAGQGGEPGGGGDEGRTRDGPFGIGRVHGGSRGAKGRGGRNGAAGQTAAVDVRVVR